MLTVIETHPIQYHAPVYRVLEARFGVPVTVIYGSDFSVAGYRDKEFGESFAWDVDLLSGYRSVFLSRLSNGGARTAEDVSTYGLKEAIYKAAPTAVLVVGYSPRFHQIAFYQAWRAGYPILFRGETTDHTRQHRLIKAWIWSRGLHWFYQQCARLLYIGQRSYQHFKRLEVSENKLVFSPYCVHTSPFQCDEVARARLRPWTRLRLGITGSQKVLLFSGKLSRRKGVDLLLEAVRQLPCEIREDIVVLFMGNGELRERLKGLARRLSLERVRFLGFQNQMDLSQYYHAADLLVLPSLHSETWGLVVNEALHHGLPCVVSQAVGCGPDLIEPGVTGEICATGSSASLSSAVRQALALVDRAEIREKCREKVSGYTVEKAAEGIAQAYGDVQTHQHSKALTSR